MARRTVKEPAKEFDLKALIDEGWELSNDVKAKTKRLEAIKAKLKDIGRKSGQNVLAGNVHTVVFSPYTKTKIDGKKFYQALADAGKKIAFWSCISILVGKAKEVMNEYDLEEITDSETDEFGTVSFK